MLALWTLEAVTPLLPGTATFQFEFNLTILMFTVLVSAGTVLFIGLYPALHSLDVISPRPQGKRDVHGTGGRRAVSQVLTTTQVALSLTLLVVAGLYVIYRGRLEYPLRATLAPMGKLRLSARFAPLTSEWASIEKDLQNGTRCGPSQASTRRFTCDIDAKDHELVGCHTLHTDNKPAALVGCRGRLVPIVRDRGSGDWVHGPANVVEARVHAALNRLEALVGCVARGAEDCQNQCRAWPDSHRNY